MTNNLLSHECDDRYDLIGSTDYAYQRQWAYSQSEGPTGVADYVPGIDYEIGRDC